MAETSPELCVPLVVPTRKSRLETYFWDEADEMSDQVAAQLYNPNKPMSRTAVIIPVAVHQEDGSVIAKTVELYAKQIVNEPFTLFLYLNCPESEVELDQTVHNRMDVEMIVRDFQETLDIRPIMHAYTEPATIGRIRKDIWDGVAKLAFFEGVYDESDGEIIAINNDIDTVSLSPRYINRIQNHYSKKQKILSRDECDSDLLRPAATLASHHYPFTTHPNTAKAIVWSDLAHKQLTRAYGGGFEAGMVIPLSDYVKNGGFDADDKTYETARVARSGKFHPSIIPGTLLRTSPRRYIDRFPENGFQIWTDETFGTADKCRERAGLGAMRDASLTQLEEHVAASLETNINYFMLEGVHRSFKELGINPLMNVNNHAELDEITVLFESIVRKKLVGKLNLARVVLSKIMDLPDVASLVESSANVDEYIAVNTAAMKKEIYDTTSFMWDSDVSVAVSEGIFQ